ncbi:MAG: pilus assembly protein [Actinobacteria bacterium]|nr:MAG: pilus assembly protein [Actinomycetota bacterium]
MKNTNRRKIEFRSQKGQAVTEFALALPILVLLLFAVIQFGITFNNYVTLTDATRAGARKAAVSRQQSSPSAVVTTAVRNSAANLTQSNLNVSVTSTWQPGADVTVTATYPYQIKLLGIPLKKGNLKSTTTERVE